MKTKSTGLSKFLIISFIIYIMYELYVYNKQQEETQRWEEEQEQKKQDEEKQDEKKRIIRFYGLIIFYIIISVIISVIIFYSIFYYREEYCTICLENPPECETLACRHKIICRECVKEYSYRIDKCTICQKTLGRKKFNCPSYFKSKINRLWN